MGKLILVFVLVLSFNVEAGEMRLMSLGFAAPTVVDDGVFTQEPVGTIVYDLGESIFKGRAESNWVPLSVASGTPWFVKANFRDSALAANANLGTSSLTIYTEITLSSGELVGGHVRRNRKQSCWPVDLCDDLFINLH